MPKRILKGVVVSDKMDKTVVVRTERMIALPKYKKRFKIHKKYKAHDEKGEFKIGDKILIQECAPISKDKKWQALEKVKVKETKPKKKASAEKKDTVSKEPKE